MRQGGLCGGLEVPIRVAGRKARQSAHRRERDKRMEEAFLDLIPSFFFLQVLFSALCLHLVFPLPFFCSFLLLPRVTVSFTVSSERRAEATRADDTRAEAASVNISSSLLLPTLCCFALSLTLCSLFCFFVLFRRAFLSSRDPPLIYFRRVATTSRSRRCPVQKKRLGSAGLRWKTEVGFWLWLLVNTECRRRRRGDG